MLVGILALIAAACGGSGKGLSIVPSPASSPSAQPRTTATAGATPDTSVTPGPSVAPSPAQSLEAIKNAASLFANGRYEAAAVAYGAIASVTTDPGIRARAELGGAVATNAAGNAPAAIALLQKAVADAPTGGTTRREAGYFLGVRLDAAGKAAEAAAVLAPLAAAPADSLTPFVLVEYATALEASGDAPAAASAWDRALALPGVDSSLQLTVYRARVAAARTTNDSTALARWLGKVVLVTGDPKARFELADLDRSAGDSAGFAAQMTAIITDSPSSAEAPLALAALKAAGVAVDAGDEGLVDYRQGKLSQAIAVLLPAIAEPGISPSALAFRTFYLAAAYDDSGATASTVTYYDAVAALPISSPYVHRAKYWAARALERSGDAVSASARYVALVIDGPSGEFTSEAAFRAGYVLFAAGNPAAAATAWQKVGATSNARLLYWQGRAQELAGDPTAARQSYTQARSADPLSFYGQAAARRLGSGSVGVAYRPRNLDQPVNWDAVATWLNSVLPGKLPGTPPTAAGALAALGMREQAATLLLDAASGADPWRLLELAREAANAGLVDVAARFAVKIRHATNVSWTAAPADLLRAAYPLAYTTQLESVARTNGIDPLFFASVVRQESYWDAAAGSSAGALGLTQVIPATGAAIAGDLGVTGFTASDLYRPSTSLAFGAYYLGQQLKQFSDPAAALAAYNAGPGNAARWQRHAPGTGLADFVESIDISETQNYVEQILDNYAHYELAYGGG